MAAIVNANGGQAKSRFLPVKAVVEIALFHRRARRRREDLAGFLPERASQESFFHLPRPPTSERFDIIQSWPMEDRHGLCGADARLSLVNRTRWGYK